MKSENIPGSIKSKSLKEAKDEINEILKRLENTQTDLRSSEKDYNKLLKLNKHVADLFKKKFKELSNKKRKWF